MDSRPYCEYWHRGRGFCVCKIYGREFQLKSNVQPLGFASSFYVYIITHPFLKIRADGRSSAHLLYGNRVLSASIRRVYSIPEQFIILPLFGRKFYLLSGWFSSVSASKSKVHSTPTNFLCLPSLGRRSDA